MERLGSRRTAQVASAFHAQQKNKAEVSGKKQILIIQCAQGQDGGGDTF